MKVRPLNDRILVKRLEEEEMTKGGIIIPDSAKEKQGILPVNYLLNCRPSRTDTRKIHTAGWLRYNFFKILS